MASLIVRRDAWRKANLPTSTTQLETSYGVTTTSSNLGTAVDGRIEANAAKSGEDPTLSNKVAASSSPATVPSHHTLQQTGRVWGRNRVAFRSPSRTLVTEFPTLEESFKRVGKQRGISLPLDKSSKHFKHASSTDSLPFEVVEQSKVKLKLVPIELCWTNNGGADVSDLKRAAIIGSLKKGSNEISH